MSLPPTVRLALRRALKSLKSPPGAAKPASDGIWNRPLTGDAWIGVFLIAVSLLGLFDISQRV